MLSLFSSMYICELFVISDCSRLLNRHQSRSMARSKCYTQLNRSNPLNFDEISQPSTTVSSDIPAATFRDVVGRCYLSWNSVQSKYQRYRDHINPELVPDLVTIMLSQKSMVTIAGITFREAHDTPNRLNSMMCLEKQNRETTC